MTTAAILLLALAGQWLLGLAAARPLLRRTPSSPLLTAESSGLAILIGVALTAWLSFIYGLCGGPLNAALSWTLTLAGFAAGGTVIWRNRRHLLEQDQTPADADEKSFIRLCHAVLLILFLALLAQTLLTPQHLWDERAIFAIKSAVLFEDETLRSPSLTHSDFVQGHPRYPLLIPLAERHIYGLLDSRDDRWSKVLFPWLYLGLTLSFAGVLQRHVKKSAAWLFTIALATVPCLMPHEYGFLSGQADAPVGSFHAVSVLYLWSILRRASNAPVSHVSLGDALAAGACAAAAAFTKDEGIAQIMVDAAALAVIGLVAFRSRAFVILPAAFLATIVLTLGPWMWYRQSLPLTNEMNYFGRLSPGLLWQRRDTLNWSVPHVLRRLFLEWRTLGLQWWLMLVALLTAPRIAMRPPQLFLIADVIGALAALVVAGMLAPAELQDHLRGSSDRYLMQIAPIAVLFAAAQWAAPMGDSQHRSGVVSAGDNA
ncbi:MAG: hypothetical protein DWQ34_06970 [Planctomycetota bacterium]|nr:MAG: hypothetical protein DWQ29_20070 [Planctomycetota bacterium]REJ95092.1 MAG: hypothetical protein DWQ34_06970 [Planctomycetota bacterium]REK21192.1 MAG: hypothetical protein DWQ41_22545 [Planctomycetota bacterium]REK29600.1 MAG: hypothetical protein DWQ45_22580 [Planctomycetota bacterium]